MPRVLILGLYYPPANFMAGRRLEGWWRHLPGFGYQPTVLTRFYDPEERNTQDFYASSRPTRSLAEDWIESDGVVYTSFSESGWSKKYLPFKLRGVGHFLWPDPDHSGWIRQCTKYLNASNLKPDLIIASYSPAGVFRVARLLSERFHIPWIADFRDLWVPENGHADFQTKLKLALQRKHLSSASGITVVTDAMAESIKSQLQPQQKPVRVIYNGTEPLENVSPDPADAAALQTFRETQARYPIILTYTGTLYPEQQVEKFLDAVGRFNERGGGPCAVVLCGNHEPQVYGKWDFVKTLGPVRFETSLFLQRESSAVFYATWPATRSIFSGKIFELAVSGRPVLVGFTPAPDLEALCRKLRSVSVFHDADELVNLLSRLPEIAANVAGEIPEIATKKYWAKQLAQFFDEILLIEPRAN